MRKVLILGSDYNSIEVVQTVKNMGLYAIVTDLMETSPAKQMADEAWRISTRDIDSLEKLCRARNVTAVLFGASDFNISNARSLCKRLNLPIYCSNDYVWSVANNKYLFKQLCEKFEIPTAEDYSDICNLEFLKSDAKLIQYPVVVKPSDECGNVGVNFCKNLSELREGYKCAKVISNGSVIVEKKIIGQEYNMHYAVADGVPELLYISAAYHENTEKENIYSLKVTDPAYLNEFDCKLNKRIKKMISSIGCKDGLVWFDCIKSKEDGNFYFLEMGYRFGGVMTYVPFKKVSGFDSIKWMVETAIGVKHSHSDLSILKNKNKTGIAISYQLFSKDGGVIKNIYGIDKIKNAKDIFVDIPKGANCNIRRNTCIGLIGIYCIDRRDAINKLKFINERIRIETEKCEDIIVHFTDYAVLE